MRLLFLAPNPPLPTTGGGSLRMFHMVRFLSERFDVDLMAPALEGAAEAERLLAERCRDILFVPPAPGQIRRRLLRLGPYEVDPALARTVRRRMAERGYAAVQIEKPAMLPYLPKGTGVPVVLDTFAFGQAGAWRALRREPGALTRARNALRLIRFTAFDTFCWPALHCILVVSEVDRIRCRRARPAAPIVIVPNGVDCGAIRPRPPGNGGPPVVVFSGDMSFEPNVDAALLLGRRIFPEIRRAHPDAELRFVGRNPDPRLYALGGGGITVTGQVADMLPHLHGATVYVAPHFTGAGTRTKLLEAMAAGLPIVTTSVGIEGIEARDGREVVIADDPTATAAAVLRLLLLPEERRRLGAAARRLAEERYDWPLCLAPLEKLYARLLPARASG